MKRVMSYLLLAVIAFGCFAVSSCVVAPPRRARVVAVAPVRVWVPGYWHRGVWVGGYWRYRYR